MNLNRASTRWQKERTHGECTDGDVKRSVTNDKRKSTDDLEIYAETSAGWHKMKNLYDTTTKMS